MNKRLRLAVLVDSTLLPVWAFCMLEQLVECDFAEIAVVIINESARESFRTNPFKRIMSRSEWQRLAYLTFRKVEKRLWKADLDPFSQRDLKELLPDTPLLGVTPEQTTYSDRFPQEVCEKLVALNIDIGIRLGFRILRGEVLTIPKYGIWSYHHGDSLNNRGGPPCFWEVLLGWPLTGVTLQILSEDLDAGPIIAATKVQTDPTFVSRNQASVYWNSAPLLPRAIKRLHQLGQKQFFKEVETNNSEPRFYSKPLFKAPLNKEFTKLYISHAGKKLISHSKSRYSEKRWAILFCLRATKQGPAKSLHRFKTIMTPEGYDWADPFVVNESHLFYIFFEAYCRKRKKATISCIKLDASGNYSEPFTVLERPYHLSYPFVFKHEGSYYMLPETGENSTIELYVATEFPYKWKLVKVLVDGISARDTTLLKFDEKWWMFTCIQERPEMSSSHELFIYQNERLVSDNWAAHLSNPVISNASLARPAGSFFRHKEQLYRPSQNCGGHYGHSVNINRVTRLDDDAYRETTVSEITPDWAANVHRVHTINFCPGLTVCDAMISF